MAPRRGGGGSFGSGSGSSPSCPGAFQDTIYSYSTPIVYFVSYCLFFVFNFILLITLSCVKKRHGNAKKLIGPFAFAGVAFQVLGFALLIIATMLRECHTIDYDDYYNFTITYELFFRISTYLLLVIVVWSVNQLLRDHLGERASLFKIAPLVILGVMGALTCGLIGLQSYNYWVNAQDFISIRRYKFEEQIKLNVAYWVLYLLSSLAAGGLAFATLMSMRSRRVPIGDIMGWTGALVFCMFFWSLIMLISWASNLSDRFLSQQTYEAFEYLIDFFQLFSWISLICLAKSNAWSRAQVIDSGLEPHMYQQPSQYAHAPVPVPPHLQQQQGYGQPGQQYYYNQQPVYNDAPELVNGHGNGHPVVK